MSTEQPFWETTSSDVLPEESGVEVKQKCRPELLARMQEPLRFRHYSRRTERTYSNWARRFIFSHNIRHSAEIGEPEINALLTYLAVEHNVSASIQDMAFSALLLPYRHVGGREIGDLIGPPKPKSLPVVLTGEEVKAVLANLSVDKWLMAALMYSAGSPLMECPRLRGQDLDFPQNEILVPDGKRAKVRITMLPESSKQPLKEHLNKANAVHHQELTAGCRRVPLPMALDRRYPNAPKDWLWVIPQENRRKHLKTGDEGRHHVHQSLIQKRVGGPVRNAGLARSATCHTFCVPLPHSCRSPATTFGPCRRFSATSM